jgi:hypothetical protein
MDITKSPQKNPGGRDQTPIPAYEVQLDTNNT